MSQADFLKMLVTQLRSQDPLNPMTNEDFAAQLAQFTSLQELQNIGATLDQSLQSNLLLTKTFNNTMSATLVGKWIEADVNTISVTDSGSAAISYHLGGAATEVNIEILDETGAVVRTIKAPAQSEGDYRINWDGMNSDGNHVVGGNYTVNVKAIGADGAPVPATTMVEGRITGVEYVDGNVVLLLGDLRVGLGQVLSILEDGTKG